MRVSLAVRTIVFALSGVLTASAAWGQSPAKTEGAAKLQGSARVVLVTGEWAPYTSESMEGKGFFMEIVSAVFKQMGRDYEVSFMPWTRAEDMVKNGDAFAALPYAINDERRVSFNFSDPVARSTGMLFAVKGGQVATNFAWKTLADLKPYILGGVRGYWYEGEFKAAGLDVQYTSDEESNMRRFAAKRYDLMPMDELGGWLLIKKVDPQNVGNYFTLSKPLNSSTLHLMVSRSYPQSAAILVEFNTALTKILKNGVYGAILKKYNLK